MNCLAVLLETSAQVYSRRQPHHHRSHRHHHSFEGGFGASVDGRVGAQTPSKVVSGSEHLQPPVSAKIGDVPGFVASVAVAGVVRSGFGGEWVERALARVEGGRGGGSDREDVDAEGSAPMQARCLGCFVFGVFRYLCC